MEATSFSTAEYARHQDELDKLSVYRNQFLFPQKNGKDVIYFCGNSLGLQPKKARDLVEEEMAKWQNQAVEGHFNGKNPWTTYHHLLKNGMARVVGALPHEVVVMNTLTVNLHLLMVSFFRPKGKRKKILMEAGAFPSDQYAVASQLAFHGLDIANCMVEVSPRKGEHLLRTEDITTKIEEIGDELALVMMGGINYYTGQFYDLETISNAAHKVGAYAGFDLAHAAGNVPVQLHDWNVDFAVWCTYKYMNSGPGGASAAFVHERFASDSSLPRFTGWWGHNEERRFLMEKEFDPIYGADGWQLSNAPILILATLRASLSLFEEAGMDKLREKSLKLTRYLEQLVDTINAEQDKEYIEILTPGNPAERGCQLSLNFSRFGKKVFEKLTEASIIADWREPSVIRIAPTPLYNSYTDVYRFYEITKKTIQSL